MNYKRLTFSGPVFWTDRKMISKDEKLPGSHPRVSAHYKCPMVVSEQIKLTNFSHHNFNLCPAGVGSRPRQQKSYFWLLFSWHAASGIHQDMGHNSSLLYVACVLRMVQNQGRNVWSRYLDLLKFKYPE